MNTREKMKLRGWSALRGKERISVIDVLKIQSPQFWGAFIFFFGFGLFAYFYYGVYSLPFGVFIGGIASALGYITRTRRSLSVELQYLNWVKVGEALDEHRT